MSMDDKISALIVDDEDLGRRILRRMLEAHPNVEIAQEVQNGVDAVAYIESHRPDLVFLDVQMPEIDGFGVLERIAGSHQPTIVFVTAFDEYAVRAFDVNAADYLLKPYDQERFDMALKRALQKVRSKENEGVNEKLRVFLSANNAIETQKERFIIKSNGRVFFLKAEEICWIEAEGNYVMLHTLNGNHLFREAISRMEQMLDDRKFQRIQRSTIVNLDYVRELQPFFRGNYEVILTNGIRLKLSKHYRQSFNRNLAGSL